MPNIFYFSNNKKKEIQRSYYLSECLFYGQCLTCGKSMNSLYDNHKCYYVLEYKLNDNLIDIITEYNKTIIKYDLFNQ